jgi:hypothetical protein
LPFSRHAGEFSRHEHKGTVLEGFRSLSRDEQYTVYEMIARSVVPGDYSPLSDDDLTIIAAQTFSLLDEEESRAQSP